MDSYIDIVVSEDSLFDGSDDDMRFYDASQSLIEYTEQLHNTLAEDYKCSISVVGSAMDKVKLSEDLDEERPYIDDIIGRVYQSFEWIRLTRAGISEILCDGAIFRDRNVVVLACEVDTGRYAITWNRGGGQAYKIVSYDNIDDILNAMEDIASFECWKQVAETW